MTRPLSIRFDAALLARLRRRVTATPGSTTSALAQRLIDEGLRMSDHPGVIFKDGSSGPSCCERCSPRSLLRHPLHQQSHPEAPLTEDWLIAAG
jgi:ribosome biogenesis GTPase A